MPHFHPIALLTSSSANDVMGESTVISKTIDALGAVHGPEVTQKGVELFNGIYLGVRVCVCITAVPIAKLFA